MEAFSCISNGKTIRGYLYWPEEKQSSYPVAIMSHGFGGNVEIMKRFAEQYTKWGYVSVIFDFCCSGSGASDGDSRDMTVWTECGDLKCVMDYVLSLLAVDRSRVFLVGCSQGGFVSALVASELQEKIKALILYYPAFCIPDDSRRGCINGTRIHPINLPDTFEAIGITLGSDYVKTAREIDVKSQACAYRGPVLIAHGLADAVVDIFYSQKAASYFKNAKLVEIEAAEHGFRQSGFDEAIVATRQFLMELNSTGK